MVLPQGVVSDAAILLVDLLPNAAPLIGSKLSNENQGNQDQRDVSGGDSSTAIRTGPLRVKKLQR